VANDFNEVQVPVAAIKINGSKVKIIVEIRTQITYIKTEISQMHVNGLLFS
jgi:hypothetical protein